MAQSPKSRALPPSLHCKQTYSSDADRLFKISPTKAEVQHQQKTNFRPTCDGLNPLSAAETSDSTQESCSVSLSHFHLPPLPSSLLVIHDTGETERGRGKFGALNDDARFDEVSFTVLRFCGISLWRAFCLSIVWSL